MKLRQFDVDLVRGIQRKLSIAKGRSSYPFISGDTYANLCDISFSKGYSLSSIQESKIPKKIFLPAALKDEFIAQLDQTKKDFSGSTLVLHNYDNIPLEDEMRRISSRFRKVYSVNWLGEKDIATTIPIGLENWGLLHNGVPADFQKLIARGLVPRNDRSIRILSSFSLHTNLSERRKVIDFCLSHKDVHHMSSFTSPRDYRELVSKSQFVLSPPGNGADCHRTWEAIYLGAIPIVHKDFWPFGHLDLPVLVVDDWFNVPQQIQDFRSLRIMNVNELSRIFLSID